MRSLQKYIALISKYPDLFDNLDEPGVIKIITDPDRIEVEQANIRADLRSQGKPRHWIDIGILADDAWFLVIRDLVQFPDGKFGGYLRIINRTSLDGGYGVVIMVKQAGKILLLRHFRHDDRQWHWEFPRGFGEASLSAEENAIKELEEEIGVTPSELVELSKVENPTGSGGIAYYFAELEPGTEIKPDISEGIASISLITTKEFEDRLLLGKIDDGFTIKAYTLARIKGLV